jgi:FMN phosphatase YigB (HAD superfamily)
MALQYKLTCDCGNCECKTQVGDSPEITLSQALAAGWRSVQVQYDSGIKTWWICPACVNNSLSDIINLMKTSN